MQSPHTLIAAVTLTIPTQETSLTMTFDELSKLFQNVQTPDEAIAIASHSLQWLRNNIDKNHDDAHAFADKTNRLEIQLLKLSLTFDFSDPCLFTCLAFNPETDQ